MTRSGTTVAAAAAVLLVGLLAGCSGSEPAPPRETPTLVATTTPTPTPTTPVLPAAARAGTYAGAEAFMRYFWVTYMYAYDTGDTAPLQAISAEECVYCKSTVEDVRSVYAEGHTFRGGAITVESVATAPLQDLDNLISQLLISQQELKVLDGDTVVKTVPATPTTATDVLTAFAANRWQVIEVDPHT